MFKKILKLSQQELKIFVYDELKKTYPNVITGDGFVFAKGSFPVLLVAHLDTVHENLPTEIIEENGTLSSPQGIGGDDRCGVYMIFEVIKKFNCSVLFCEDEELGSIGAKKFVKSNASNNLDFNYIIEFDRKGSIDAVFYKCKNKEFEDFITSDYFKTNIGTGSDICHLAPRFNCAAVNLSCGYYSMHTLDEYIVLEEMHDSILNACKILERTDLNKKFEFIE
jgi:di/tripeptidase